MEVTFANKEDAADFCEKNGMLTSYIFKNVIIFLVTFLEYM